MYPICILKEKFENLMELLLIGNEDESQGNKSHYVYIKDFNRFMYNNTKHKEKSIFIRIVYNVLAVKNS